LELVEWIRNVIRKYMKAIKDSVSFLDEISLDNITKYIMILVLRQAGITTRISGSTTYIRRKIGSSAIPPVCADDHDQSS